MPTDNDDALSIHFETAEIQIQYYYAMYTAEAIRSTRQQNRARRRPRRRRRRTNPVMPVLTRENDGI